MWNDSPVMRCLILIPTYNESASIVRLLGRIDAVRTNLIHSGSGLSDIQVLILDDNSPDGTADIVETLAKDWVQIARRPGKSGLGPAYIAGFREGLSQGFELLVEMDADLSHQPEALPSLLEPVLSNRADLTIGTRWMPGGKVVNWPLTRQWISRVGTGYARIALGLTLRDVTSGFRVFRSDVIRSIDLNRIESRGYGFQIEMVLRTIEKNFRILEVPITFVERDGGVSKMSKKIVLEALWKVTVWGFLRLR